MTTDERLEALLNRAGQTISDLPHSDGCHLTYDRDSRSLAEREVFRFAGMPGKMVDIIDCLAMHQDYILHLTDVIDRMETALENVIGERDWLADYYKDNELMPWRGIPEDWRVDE